MPVVWADAPPMAVLHIGYLSQAVRHVVPAAILPTVDVPSADDGVQGARLAIADNNTTGSFTGQSFLLDESIVPEGGDVADALRKMIAGGLRLDVADLPEAQLLAVAALPEAATVTLFTAAINGHEPLNP
jgi:hypothetical protein